MAPSQEVAAVIAGLDQEIETMNEIAKNAVAIVLTVVRGNTEIEAEKEIVTTRLSGTEATERENGSGNIAVAATELPV